MLLRKVEAVTRKRDAVSMPDSLWVRLDDYRAFYAEHYKVELPSRSALLELMVEHMLSADKDFGRWVTSQSKLARNPSRTQELNTATDTRTETLPGFGVSD